MKVKTLIEELSRLDPEEEIFVTNGMGYPAHDYEGGKWAFRLSSPAIHLETSETPKISLEIFKQVE